MRKLWIPLVLAVAVLCAHAATVPVAEEVRTAEGPVTVSSSHTLTPQSLAAAMYPGAKIVDGSEYVVKTEDGKLAQVRVLATLQTKSSVADVQRFYGKALKGGGSKIVKSKGKAVLWKVADGKVWIVSITGKAGQPTSIDVRHAAKYKRVVAEYPGAEAPRRTRPVGPPQSI